MRRRLAVAGVAGLVVVVSAVAGVRLAGLGAAREWVTVERRDVPLVVEGTGKLEAAVAYQIGPPSVPDTWNYNLTWMIPEGRWVDKGDVVARFDATDVEEQLRDLEAKLETVRQEREKEQRSLEVALREMELDLVRAESDMEVSRIDASIDPSLVGGIEVQEARLRQELARRRYELLAERMDLERTLVRSKLEVLDVKRRYYEGKIARLRAVLDTFSVRAPIAGLVIYVPKRNGQRWEVGERVWMMAKILEVADIRTLRAEVAVLEADAARLAVGQPAEVSIDAIPGMTLRTEVAALGRIVRERSIQDRSKVFDVYLPLTGFDDGLLRPGMGISARITTDVLEDRLVVPLAAIRTDADGPYVEVRGTAGAVRRRPVTLGQRTGELVIVESGLDAGERVLLPESGAEDVR
ncbi:MAG: hypothetical protein Kow0062_21360 [Acidobacteriota bacterium]|nr:MAG: efflux RND transporter periplasmic adaptor subunit [Acidobacteriota bacterium]